MREKDGETAALVPSRSMSYTEENNASLVNQNTNNTSCSSHQELSAEEEEADFVAEESVLSQFHEDAMQQAGFGFFQWITLFISGLGLSGVSAEIFVIPYILPNAEVELCIPETQKKWLTAITFLGLLVGALLWGSLSDRIGRKRTLLSSLSFYLVFNIIAAFMPTFGLFITARFCSAAGHISRCCIPLLQCCDTEGGYTTPLNTFEIKNIGGYYPVVFTYYGEFLPKAVRSKHLNILMLFWVFGGLYVVIIAWFILPKSGLDVVMENKEHFSPWHQFLLLCLLPSILSVIGLVFLSESPHFLLEAGRDVEAMMVYQLIYKSNNSAHAQYQLSELELPSNRHAGRNFLPPANGKTVIADMTNSLNAFWNSFLEIVSTPYLSCTAELLIICFMTGLAFYGLSWWFPERLSFQLTEAYHEHMQLKQGLQESNAAFNASLENTWWADSTFVNCNFTHVFLSHVVFDNCTFENMEFIDVKSSRTYFKNSIIKNSRFVDTDFTADHFKNCTLSNNTMITLEKICTLDFDSNINMQQVFTENFARLFLLPIAIIMSALTISWLGRTRILAGSLLFCSGASLLIWLLHSEESILVYEALLMASLITAIGAVNITIIETYPTHIRATAFGLLWSAYYIGGLLGITLYTHLVTYSLLTTAVWSSAVLLLATVPSFKLSNAFEA